MNKTVLLLLSLLVASEIVGCTNEPSETAFDVDAMWKIIEEKNQKFTEAHVTGDVAVINAYFASDAKIFLPGAPLVTGSEAIAQLNQDYVSYGISEFREKTTALYGTKEYLIEEGTYSMTYGDENTVEVGKYINIWKPEAGDWKVRANIWNSSM